jgi:hypothetical protein
MAMANPAIQSFHDLPVGGQTPCFHYANRLECPNPRFGCVQIAGAKMARYVIEFYTEANERTLAMEKEKFRQRAPLPPDQVEAYIDTPERNFQQITDPEAITQHVWEYARAVLDLKPGERIFRSSEENYDLPLGSYLMNSGQEIVTGHSKASI